jgi:CubicO group peptidase (beta-lactamase class C family)
MILPQSLRWHRKAPGAFCALFAALCVSSGCFGTGENTDSAEARKTRPEEAGFDPMQLADLTAAIRSQEYPNVHALLIERGGHVVYEEYFSGEDVRRGVGPLGYVEFDAGVRHDVRSVTKSITSALVGIALHDGLIASVDQPLVDFFPEYASLASPENRTITLRHALTMSGGLEWNEAIPYSDSTNDEIRMNRSMEPVRYVLSRPLVAQPGAEFNYSGGLSQLLAAIVQRSAGRPLLEYAQDVLFAPLGISDVEWVDDGHSVPSAASGLRKNGRSGSSPRLAQTDR